MTSGPTGVQMTMSADFAIGESGTATTATVFAFLLLAYSNAACV